MLESLLEGWQNIIPPSYPEKVSRGHKEKRAEGKVQRRDDSTGIPH